MYGPGGWCCGFGAALFGLGRAGETVLLGWMLACFGRSILSHTVLGLDRTGPGLFHDDTTRPKGQANRETCIPRLIGSNVWERKGGRSLVVIDVLVSFCLPGGVISL